MAADDALRERRHGLPFPKPACPRAGRQRSGRAHVAPPETVEEHLTTTRSTLPRLAVLGTAIALFAAACGPAGTASQGPGATGGTGGNMDALVAAAKAEGALNVIALPHD